MTISKNNIGATILTHSPQHTEELGKVLGENLEGGEIICLRGPLGSGKTTFTRGIALGLGLEQTRYTPSPSFTLIREYNLRLPLYHMDFYRLSDEGEIWYLGIDEYFSSGGVCVIEWADRLGNLTPQERLDISFAFCSNAPEERQVTLVPYGSKYEKLLTRLKTGGR